MGKHFEKGKHSNNKENKKLVTSKIVKFFSVIIIASLIVIVGIKGIQEADLFESTKEKNSRQEESTVDINNIPDKMGEYKVLGVLVIDKLGLQKNILEETNDDSLSLAITKFYGPDLNEVGNFCITGHNYKDIFESANDLELKDTFYIIDKAKKQKITYEIFDKFSVNPTEVDRVLKQEIEGTKEVTLITCNPGGYTRLILKAREI